MEQPKINDGKPTSYLAGHSGGPKGTHDEVVERSPNAKTLGFGIA